MLSSIELVCVAAPCQPHQGRFTAKNFIYVFTLHQTAFQPSKAVRPLCGSGSRNFINSYRCLIYITPLLPVPALSLLGAGRLITFGAVLTSKLFSSCRTAFSDFRVEDIRSYPQAHSFHPRHFQGMPYVAAWASCRSSIFFQRNCQTIPPNWSVDMNQQP